MTAAQMARMCELVDNGCIKADAVQPAFLSRSDLDEILGYGLTEVAETSAYISNDISTVSDAIKEITKDFENEKEKNMKKEVLFLAPNWQHVKTVISNLSKTLDKKKIPYAGSPKEFETDNVHVQFVCSDPLKWNNGMFKGKVAVFGKKELVNKAKERFPSSVCTTAKSVDKYILENETNCTNPITPPPTSYLPEIKNVHFSGPATVVIWADGTKTMVMCQEGDIYSEEAGLALCIAKKAFGNMPNFNNIFRKWVPEDCRHNRWARYLARTIEDDDRRHTTIQKAYDQLVQFRDADNSGKPACIDVDELIGYLGEALE